MRAPLSWIREFTPLDNIEVAAISDALDQLGLEVEAIDEPGRDVNGVIAAKILDVVPHPDADRIRLADVDYGGGQIRVVCGAPNIAPGMVVPFAQVGAVLPGDFKIERRKIRGIVSEGMLCSARELGLGDDHAGILELAADAPLGTDVREILGLDDVVFDLAITPNRPDAMGIVGVARDLAAHFGLPFTVEEHEPAPINDSVAGAHVIVEAPDRCPRFVALAARVVMGESPAWMQRRLTLAGMRPISNVVDVTNYVMLERCRPLHAFDLGRLPGRGIVVRLAGEGEKMTTLDGVERTLTGADLLVCDGERAPQSIAGIMGGAAAEVSDATTEVLLESAYFEPSGIARTSKRLGLRSEASARFERGVDPNNAGSGAARAMELFALVAEAVPAAGAIDVYPQPIERRRITVRTERVNQLLGTALSADDIAAYLTPLDIEVNGTEASAPTFRPDLEREIDLIEEVARRVGLDAIVRTIPSSPEKVGGLSPQQRDRRIVADVLVGVGYDEVFSLPLLAPADLTAAGLRPEGVIEVENPLRSEESILRPALLPGVLRAVAFNAAHGEADVALFESGTVFAPPLEGAPLPNESRSVAFVRAHHARRAPHEPNRPVDVYDATAALNALAQELRIADLQLEAATVDGFHPTRAARVLVDGQPIGAVGEVATEVVDALSLVGPVVACEIDVDALLAGARVARAAPRIAFPGIVRRPRVRRRRSGPCGRVGGHAHAGGWGAARERRVVRRLPLRRARRGTREPGVRAAVPGPGSHAHRRRSQRSPSEVHRRGRVGAWRRAPQLSRVFTHRIRVRYAEIDGQGVVFNAHWLTYFDDTCTRFMESLGFGPEFWTIEFDVMLVRAVLDWKGSARFDQWVEITAAPVRLGTKSFDLRYSAQADGQVACEATITYVAVQPGVNTSIPIPSAVRRALEARLA